MIQIEDALWADLARYHLLDDPDPALPARIRTAMTQKAEAMARRHEMYNRQMEEIDSWEAAEAALVIRPPEPLNIGHREKNPEELERVYRIGRQEAEKRLAEIRQWTDRE